MRLSAAQVIKLVPDNFRVCNLDVQQYRPGISCVRHVVEIAPAYRGVIYRVRAPRR